MDPLKTIIPSMDRVSIKMKISKISKSLRVPNCTFLLFSVKYHKRGFPMRPWGGKGEREGGESRERVVL